MSRTIFVNRRYHGAMTHDNLQNQQPPFDPDYDQVPPADAQPADVPPTEGQPAVDGQQAASGQPVTNAGQQQAETQNAGAQNAGGQQEMIGATGNAQGDNNLEKDPSDWVSGDDPMTEAQKSYLDTLAKQAGEQLPANLTKAQASEHIDRLKGITGM